MYAVQAQYTYTREDGYTSSRQIPTFYLDENVQGIVNEQHAEIVAREILTAAVVYPSPDHALHVSVVKL